MDPITIEPATIPTDEVRALVTELEQVLAAEYPPEQRHGLPVAALFADFAEVKLGLEP